MGVSFMKHFILVVKYESGKVAMLTDEFDIRKALDRFYFVMMKEFPYESKDFAVPMVLSCELIPVAYTSYKEGKKFALITKYDGGKSAMITDKPDINTALTVLGLERQMDNPADKSGGSAYIDIKSCELLPVMYESIYG